MNANPVPLARKEPNEVIQFAQQLLVTQTIRQFGGRADLVVLGDSIVQGWQWSPAWQRLTEARKALNFGIGGDRTENLLWRLEQRLVDDLHAPYAAVLIGVNNVWSSPPAAEVVAGITACVRRLRQGMPDARIAVYGIFPLRDRNEHFNPLVTEINRGIVSSLLPFDVSFRDMGPKLRDAQGVIAPELMPDGCHIADAAYHRWTDDLIGWMEEVRPR